MRSFAAKAGAKAPKVKAAKAAKAAGPKPKLSRKMAKFAEVLCAANVGPEEAFKIIDHEKSMFAHTFALQKEGEQGAQDQSEE